MTLIYQTITLVFSLTALLIAPPTLAQTQPLGDKEVFMIVEKPPTFPGGNEALVNFLETNLIMPESALKAKITGRVFVSFIVNQDGSLVDFQLGEAGLLTHGCAEEALRVARLMPNWLPGNQSGKTLRVKQWLPIWFPVAKNRTFFLKK